MVIVVKAITSDLPHIPIRQKGEKVLKLLCYRYYSNGVLLITFFNTITSPHLRGKPYISLHSTLPPLSVSMQQSPRTIFIFIVYKYLRSQAIICCNYWIDIVYENLSLLFISY